MASSADLFQKKALELEVERVFIMINNFPDHIKEYEPVLHYLCSRIEGIKDENVQRRY